MPQPTPLPAAPPAALGFFVAVDGNDTHAGTQQAPFATLLRASQAVRAAACRGSTPPWCATHSQSCFSLAVCLSERFRSRLLTHSGCSAAVVTVMPGQYDLNETLSLVSLCTAPAVCVFGLPCGLPLNADTNHWHVKMQMW